jgi:hypothetical protein
VPGSTWEPVAALATVASAAIGAVAAWNSRRAALASERTSREAREALVVALEPELQVEFVPVGSHVELRVIDMGRWGANELEAEVTFADRERKLARRARLEPFSADDDWWIPLRTVTAEWPPRQAVEQIEAAVRFLDTRSIARYQHTVTAQLRGGDGLPDVESTASQQRRLK